MAENFYDPDDNLLAEIRPLHAVVPELGDAEEMDWQPLKFDDHEHNSDSLFLKADPSLQVLYSYPEPCAETDNEYECATSDDEQSSFGTINRYPRRQRRRHRYSRR